MKVQISFIVTAVLMSLMNQPVVAERERDSLFGEPGGRILLAAELDTVLSKQTKVQPPGKTQEGGPGKKPANVKQ